MDNKTKARVIIYSVVFGLFFIASLVVPCLFSQSVYAPIIGGLVGLLVIGIMIIRFYPVWFKDYIERFWEYQRMLEESKNGSEESEAKAKEGC